MRWHMRWLVLTSLAVLLTGSAAGENRLPSRVERRAILKSDGHGAAAANQPGDDLKNFKPEFYPNKYQARLYLRDKTLAHLPPPSHGINAPNFFIFRSRRWEVGSTVSVSFKGGDSALYAKIEQAAGEWTKHANLKFNFKDASGDYRTYAATDTQYASQIRVSFDHPDGGYWSLIGTDSNNKDIVGPGEPSLNLDAFDRQLPSNYAATVIHEFGHAIGFLHEHQSPVSGCDAEFKWEDDANGPGIYTLMAQQGWSKAMVDFNMRQMPNSSAYDVGPYDRLSIMHYYFPPQFFVHGSSSSCSVPRNVALSPGDIVGTKQAYPSNPMAIQAVREDRVKHLNAIINFEKVDPHVKQQFEMHLRNMAPPK